MAGTTQPGPGTVRLHRVLATRPEKVYRAFLEGEDGQKKGRPVVSILLRDLDEPCLSALDEFFQQVAKRLK